MQRATAMPAKRAAYHDKVQHMLLTAAAWGREIGEGDQ